MSALGAMMVRLSISNEGVLMVEMRVQPILLQEIKETQRGDEELKEIHEKMQVAEVKDFIIREDGCLYFRDRLCVSKVEELRRRILSEAHSSRYAMHPGTTKMYHNLKSH